MHVLYGIQMFAVDYFVLSQSMRLTDGQTEMRQSYRAYAFAVAR